jgi:hypothetical protein
MYKGLLCISGSPNELERIGIHPNHKKNSAGEMRKGKAMFSRQQKQNTVSTKTTEHTEVIETTQRAGAPEGTSGVTGDQRSSAIHQRLANKYDLQKNAADDGRQNMPEWDSIDWSVTERHIERDIEQEMQIALDQGGKGIAEICANLDNITQQVNGLYYVPGHERSLDDLRALFADDRIQKYYSEYYRDYKLAEREYKWFRQSNKIQREAIYPESKLFNWSIIIAICFAEAAANSVLFAKGSDLGLLGGLLQALIVAALNGIVMGGAMGYLAMRRRNLVDPLKRFSGYALAALILAINFTFNLAVGHYRAELVIGSLNPEKYAFDSLLSNPLGLQDLEAWLLFFVGIAAFCVTSYEFYRLDDKYPGYGDVDRRLKENLANVNEHNKSLDNEARQITERAINKIDSEIEMFHRYASEYSRLFPKMHLPALSARKVVEAHQAAYQTLIHEYRDINGKVRGTRPCAYWELPLRLGHYVEDAARQMATVEAQILKSQENAQKMRNDADLQHEQISQHRKELRQSASEIISVGKETIRIKLQQFYEADHSLERKDLI